MSQTSLFSYGCSFFWWRCRCWCPIMFVRLLLVHEHWCCVMSVAVVVVGVGGLCCWSWLLSLLLSRTDKLAELPAKESYGSPHDHKKCESSKIDAFDARLRYTCFYFDRVFYIQGTERWCSKASGRRARRRSSFDSAVMSLQALQDTSTSISSKASSSHLAGPRTQ